MVLKDVKVQSDHKVYQDLKEMTEVLDRKEDKVVKQARLVGRQARQLELTSEPGRLEVALRDERTATSVLRSSLISVCMYLITAYEV